jgi:hypothetical protein
LSRPRICEPDPHGDGFVDVLTVVSSAALCTSLAKLADTVWASDEFEIRLETPLWSEKTDTRANMRAPTMSGRITTVISNSMRV